MSGNREGNSDIFTHDSNGLATENNSSLHLRQKELIQKCTELKVLRDLRAASEATITHKRELLKKETNSLDELHNEVWTLQDEQIERVWNFSRKHDFGLALNNCKHPAEPVPFCSKCEPTETIEENVTIANGSYCPAIFSIYIKCNEKQELLREIQELEFELQNNCYKSLKKDLFKAEKELQKFEVESPEIQRLMSDIDSAKKRIALIKSKIEHNLINVSNDDTTASRAQTCANNMGSGVSYSRADSSIPDNRVADHRNVSPMMIDSSVNSNVKKIGQDNSTTQQKWPRQTSEEYSCYYSGLDSGSTKVALLASDGCDEEVHFNNTPSCEKIIAEAESNDERSTSTSSTAQPRKKFAFKTKSLITKGVKNSASNTAGSS